MRACFSLLGALLAAGCTTSPESGRPPARFERSPSLRTCGLPYRLGIARYTMWNTPFETALDIVERIDCHYMSLLEGSIDYRATDAEIAGYKAKFAARGIEVDTLGPCYFFDEKSIDEAFSFAKRYGMKMISVVPAEEKTVDGKTVNVESEAMIDVLERMVRKYDIKAAIHNHGPESPYMFPTGESIWKRIEKRDRRIGFCFDVGHQARFGGGDPAKFIREHADRIYDVHLKNIKIDPVQNLAKEGPRGELDIPGILKALADVGFDGVLHIEYEKDHGDNLAPLAESFGYYRGVMDALATGITGNCGGRGLLALSFDDRNFKGWIDALPLFAKYNAHATFFVEGPIDEEAATALRRLSAAGHSIGLHGLKHANADAEIAAKGSERYFDEEIRPQLDACRAAGLSITAFAYPNCRGTDATDVLFASKGFHYVRGGVKGVAPFDPKGDLKGKLPPLHTEDRVFVPRTGLGRTPRVDTVILGESYNTDIEDVKACIRRASSRDEALFLTSHNIAPDARFIHLRTDWLEQILSTARETGMPVVGFDELPARRQEKEVK